MSQNAQNSIFREVGLIFAPLTSADSAYRVTALFRDLGYELPGGNDFPDFPGLVTRVEETIQALIHFDQADDDAQEAALGELVQKIVELIKEVIALGQTVKDAVATFPEFIANAPLDQLPVRLLDYLIIEYTRYRRQPIHAVMKILGVFEQLDLEAKSEIFQPATSLRMIQWERLPKLVSDPAGLFDEVYAWNTAFDSNKFFTNVNGVLQAFLLPGGMYTQTPTVKAALGNSADGLKELRFPIFQNAIFPTAYSQFGLNLTAVQANGEKKPGFAIIPYIFGAAEFDFDLNETFEIIFTITASVDSGLGIIIRPDTVEFLANLFNAPQDAVVFDTQLSLTQRQGSGEIVLFGSPGATRFAVEGPEINVFVGNQISGVDAGAEFKLDAARLVIAGGEGDGFLQKVLPKEGFNITFELGIGWSNKKGLYFRGGAGFEVTLPIHLDLFGVLKIDSVYLAIQVKSIDDSAGIDTAVAASIDLKLGPIAANVERMGLGLLFTFPPDGGIKATLGFKPPRGVGMVIDAGAVVGGGYLFFDYDKGQYGGILQIEVKGTVSIKVIGLITTKMPDGSPGFSLLFIITVEFSPIQLGYGFTLNGVGGLAGFNRTMNVDALRDGIKNRTLDSILFPPDPIANARKIISDLQTVFPPAPGRFVFAPMVKLGWGAGILLIEVGLAVELPWPLRLAILGKLHLQLPPAQQGSQQEQNIIQLHMDVLGILDFDRGEVSVDAILYDSLLVIFPITGGMAMRIRWGSNPVFLMSVGGLNPRFPQPPDFPTLDRLGLQLSYDKNGIKARLRLISYFAVTPNTLQFGARLDAYAEVKVAQIEAYMGFDALIEFHPFHFIVDLYGGVSVRAFGFTFGVDLLLTLSGPKPFNGDGHVIINFLGKHKVAIHFTIGEDISIPALPPVDPLPELIAAFKDLNNWSAALPSSGNMLVTLRQLGSDEMKDKVLAHPLGELTVRQRVLPLGIALERFGASVPTTPGPFNINHFLLGSNSGPNSGLSVRDAFAPGQFLNLSEDEKLIRPAFESFLCGQTSIGTEDIKIPSSAIQLVVFEYEVTIIDDKDAKQRRDSRNDGIPMFALEENAFLRAAQYGAARQTPMQSMGSAKFAGAEMGIRVQDPTYVVAGMDDLHAQGSDVFPTFTEAEAVRMSDAQTELQVVEAYEVL